MFRSTKKTHSIDFSNREINGDRRSRVPILRSIFFALALFFGGLFFTRPALSQAIQSNVSTEFQLKAACLYNFAKYVRWPQISPENLEDPIRICVVAPSPFGELFSALKNKTAQDRPVVATVISATTDPTTQGCHILFYPSSKLLQGTRLGGESKYLGILTVSEETGNGIVMFVMKDGKLRFEIDLGKARASGLTISSQMLKLAIAVTGVDSQEGEKS